VIQAVAAIATTIGVLVALYVAVIREPRKTAEERRHHRAQMDALHRAESERVAAQARKVVPSCIRTPMFGDSWWTVRIDNASSAVTTILAVDVVALDANDFEVAHGCSQAPPSFPIQDAIAGHFVSEWPRALTPNQHAAMAYTTINPNYKLRMVIDYEDEAGFRWHRTDTSQPTRKE
jgi:hypothetical protein